MLVIIGVGAKLLVPVKINFRLLKLSLDIVKLRPLRVVSAVDQIYEANRRVVLRGERAEDFSLDY